MPSAAEGEIRCANVSQDESGPSFESTGTVLVRKVIITVIKTKYLNIITEQFSNDC